MSLSLCLVGEIKCIYLLLWMISSWMRSSIWMLRLPPVQLLQTRLEKPPTYPRGWGHIQLTHEVGKTSHLHTRLGKPPTYIRSWVNLQLMYEVG